MTNYHSHQVDNYQFTFRVVTKPEMIDMTVEDITYWILNLLQQWSYHLSNGYGDQFT